ncbi:hypothetical protein [Alkalinema sp. FACHB-956]|uniref:hypothetical protein n=1 Tax=Alkalinema sp. FACHB-956 TaxID=2692768 RepID=UPI0016852E33|nr:hypothetical protein [Alkalinema sp. FACHB-956]MBD2325419.1 hypothetical protein [Alkalinema sp. FACHB-956]
MMESSLSPSLIRKKNLRRSNLFIKLALLYLFGGFVALWFGTRSLTDSPSPPQTQTSPAKTENTTSPSPQAINQKPQTLPNIWVMPAKFVDGLILLSNEQGKILFPILLTLPVLCFYWMVSTFIDTQVDEELDIRLQQALKELNDKETSEGIKVRQELEFFVILENLWPLGLSIQHQLDLNSLAQATKAELLSPNWNEKVDTITMEEKERDAALNILEKVVKNDQEHEVLLILAKNSTLKALSHLNISQQSFDVSLLAKSFEKDIYIILKAWLWFGLKRGREFPVALLPLSAPDRLPDYIEAINQVSSLLDYQDFDEIFKKEPINNYKQGKELIKKKLRTFAQLLENHYKKDFPRAF